MELRSGSRVFVEVLAVLALGCGSEPLAAVNDDGADDVLGGGSALLVPVSADATTYVSLSEPRVLAPGAAAGGLDWDLAFRGFDVLTNGGVSGPGAGAAFGVLSAPTWLSDTAPAVPFLTRDEAGGAFRGWYAYDGANHEVLSRYHVYGVRDERGSFKVQILSYYGGIGAAVAGMFRIRYAAFGGDEPGATRELADLDATAGGDATDPQASSVCLDLATGATLPLLSTEARESVDWHLCFRRDAISVNGGVGGPRGVTAADLDANAAGETIETLRESSDESELPRFDVVGEQTLGEHALAFRGDGVVSAFTDRWLVPGADPNEPTPGVWLVLGADGDSRFLLSFERFRGATAESPGTIELRVKSVR
jgi:hypothetical protein